jgi:hypothetical protein
VLRVSAVLLRCGADLYSGLLMRACVQLTASARASVAAQIETDEHIAYAVASDSTQAPRWLPEVYGPHCALRLRCQQLGCLWRLYHQFGCLDWRCGANGSHHRLAASGTF